MTPEDPRHGTNAGYVAGCRGQGCLRAKTRYDKRRRLELLETGRYRKTPSYRVTRRIQALQALGWSVPAIATRAGLSERHLYNLGRHTTTYVTTFEAIDRVYEALSMTPPAPVTTRERISVTRARRFAERAGWPPPLAWDDIDDEGETPTDWSYRPAARAEVLADILDRGAGVSDACRVLRMSRSALQKWCGNNDLSHLYRALAARENGFRGNQHLEAAS